MPRRRTPLSPKQYYHLYNRGNDRGRIFFEDENYLFFLGKVHRYLCPVFDIVAYCLMPTHYHFLVRIKELEREKVHSDEAFEGEWKTSEVSETSEVSSTPAQSAVSEAMRRFSISYTKAINKRFDRVGALFQGTYKAKHIAEESYLISLSRYVHLNPVAAGLVKSPAAWRFSSYRDYIGERAGRLPRPDVVLGSFVSRKAYLRFGEDQAQPSEGVEWREALFEQ